MSIFKDSFNAINRLFVNEIYRVKTPDFIDRSIYNCKEIDVSGTRMMRSELNDNIELYFIFKDLPEDKGLVTVELFMDNLKRNIAFIIPESFLTDNITDYGRLFLIEKIYKYIFNIHKICYKGECSKKYSESETHYLLDIAPTILAMLSLYNRISSDTFKYIPEWLKHEAPRYNYDNRIVEEVLRNNDVGYLFDDYFIVSIIKDLYDPLSKKRVDTDE